MLYFQLAKIHFPWRHKASLLILSMMLALIGCGQGEGARRVTSGVEARELLESLRYDYIQSAARHLEGFDYERITESVALHTSGDTAAFERVRMRMENGEARTILDSASGAFPGSVISRVLGREPNFAPDSTTLQAILPADPPYLASRTRDAYGVEIVNETDRPAIEVTLTDEGEVETDIRRVLLTYEPDSRQVTRVRVERVDDTFLAEARSVAELELVQVDDSTWLPGLFSYQHFRDAPLQRPFDLRKTERYGSYRKRQTPIGSGP